MQPEAQALTRAGRWAELSQLGDDDMLNTFAVIGSPSEVARQIAERFQGLVERVSPVIYQPDVELLATLCSEIRAATT